MIVMNNDSMSIKVRYCYYKFWGWRIKRFAYDTEEAQCLSWKMKKRTRSNKTLQPIKILLLRQIIQPHLDQQSHSQTLLLNICLSWKPKESKRLLHQNIILLQPKISLHNQYHPQPQSKTISSREPRITNLKRKYSNVLRQEKENRLRTWYILRVNC